MKWWQREREEGMHMAFHGHASIDDRTLNCTYSIRPWTYRSFVCDDERVRRAVVSCLCSIATRMGFPLLS